MKLQSIALVLISLVCLSNATSLFTYLMEKKAHKKVKVTKAKAKGQTAGDYGGGSWNDGFRCKEIWISKNNGNLNNEGTGTFYAPRIQTPVSIADRYGLCFSFETAVGSNLTAVTVQDGNYRCLPYRYITQKCTYTNPSGDYKYIECFLKIDDGNLYKIKINLPYAYTGYYISDDEGSKICDLIYTKSTANRGDITNNKSRINQCAATYKVSKNNAATATGTAADAATQQKNYEDQITALTAQLATASSTADALKKNVDADNDRDKTLSSGLDAARSNVNNLAKTSEDLQIAINNASDSSKSQADITKQAQLDSNQALSTFNTEIDILGKQAPQAGDKISDAKAGNEALDTTKVNNSVDAIKSN